MKKLFLLIFTVVFVIQYAQSQSSEAVPTWEKIYRAFPEKANDMVHTKLEAEFDYQKSQLNGKVWLTLKPHFYATDSLKLDAKGMDIHTVQLIETAKNTPLKYTYDSLTLHICLGKMSSAEEEYTVYIEYTAKPNDLKINGIIANNKVKGLYFINPEGKDKDKPTQIWTHGETESNSSWIPIIDKPNQKSTQEMILTVPEQYVTLSNGSLANQKTNSDGTRTDTWKMEQPHAPYLFFMGVGDYAIVKDSYKGKEVNYYVEKPYEDVARKIFGDTPEMVAFFSEILGVEYPWVKYAQMTARDFVSGAMENTTATMHMDAAQQNARELTDGNMWETIIAHELFHQWFGDLVTCESWSNLTLNESFANFSEGMWTEYKHGKDQGQAVYFNSLNMFLTANADSGKALVRYYYAEMEDLFDRVSYEKGGSVLNMLKNFVGEEAFYQSLNIYLTKNRFGTGNVHKLQQAFEDVTGKDMNWFFNQWYFGAGYPDLEISYDYNEQDNLSLVYVEQKQTEKIFKLPVKIDVYEDKSVVRYTEWIEHAKDTFRYVVNHKPDLINVDADKVLVAKKKDNKTLNEFIFQYQNAKNYVDRWEAVDYAGNHLDEENALTFLQTTLKDPNYWIRLKTLQSLNPKEINDDLLAEVVELVKSDPNKIVSAIAINTLSDQKNKKYKKLYINSLSDSSYFVAGLAYMALIDIDERAAIAWLPKLKTDAKGVLEMAVKKAEILTKTDTDFDEMYTWISNVDDIGKRQNLLSFILYLKNLNDTAHFRIGIAKVLEIRDEIVKYYPPYKEMVRTDLIKLKEAKETKKGQRGQKNNLTAQIGMLNEILSSPTNEN